MGDALEDAATRRMLALINEAHTAEKVAEAIRDYWRRVRENDPYEATLSSADLLERYADR